MNLEETLPEVMRDSPSFVRSPDDLVQADIEQWEETDHFSMLYGQKMLDDALDKHGEMGDDALEDWQEYKTAFWEGYLDGRRGIGKDIYAQARKLWSAAQKKSAKPKATRKSRSKPSGSMGMTRMSG